MSKQNNLVSFRLKDDVLFAIEQRLKEDQSIAQFCQQLIYNHFDLPDKETLNKEDFYTIIDSIVHDRIQQLVSTAIKDLDYRVQELEKPKSTARKQSVNRTKKEVQDDV